jgi:anthranilate synthase component 2
MILMIDNFDSFTYNVVQYLGELGHKPSVYRNDIPLEKIQNMQFDALVVSPGPCSPEQAGVSCDAINYCAKMKIPVLGICLGHQCIGHTFDAEIVHAPYLMHGKNSNIIHDNKGLFKNLPQNFSATRYHSLTIKPESCPDCLIVNAKTQDDIIMGVTHSELPIYGVQFHPESCMSEHGHKLIQNFLDIVFR